MAGRFRFLFVPIRFRFPFFFLLLFIPFTVNMAAETSGASTARFRQSIPSSLVLSWTATKSRRESRFAA